MEERHQLDKIDYTSFNSLLKQYPSFVSGKLETLDTERYNTIPDAVAQRAETCITKDELITLMDWKLAHGKFRPALPKLIRENYSNFVEKTTREAFQGLLKSSANIEDVDLVSVRACLDQLCQLRGVGPATASLLMSIFDKDHHPFFSDELYRWSHFMDPAGTTKATAGQGWDRKIDYSAKAYLSLYEKVAALRRRIMEDDGVEIAALEIEKVAFVFGRSRGVEAKAAEKKRVLHQSWVMKGGGRKRAITEASAADADKQDESASAETASAEKAPDHVAQSDILPRKRGRTNKAKT